MFKRIIISLFLISLLSGCTSRSLVEGSEATYRGIVTDRAMSSNSYDRYGRAYINILTDSGELMLFWYIDDAPRPNGLKIGDYVEIQSSIEEESNYLVATSVEIL